MGHDGIAERCLKVMDATNLQRALDSAVEYQSVELEFCERIVKCPKSVGLDFTDVLEFACNEGGSELIDFCLDHSGKIVLTVESLDKEERTRLSGRLRSLIAAHSLDNCWRASLSLYEELKETGQDLETVFEQQCRKVAKFLKDEKVDVEKGQLLTEWAREEELNAVLQLLTEKIGK
ncbi:hypothetical protein HDU98_001005 [Podochytrium sp. JEL0797]|nr:hypothetical protein HDU98_001005 [Podochytrium sp. JEL0797]